MVHVTMNIASTGEMFCLNQHVERRHYESNENADRMLEKSIFTLPV
jgi:hypothetical protein